MRVLLVDDSEDDARLIRRALAKGVTMLCLWRVETAGEFERALAAGEWDLVLADFALPRFGGLEALARLETSAQEVPLIMLSSAVDEERVVASIRAGATDYVMKENFTRLLPALLRAREESALRRERQQVRTYERLVVTLSGILNRLLHDPSELEAVARLVVPDLAQGCALCTHDLEGGVEHIVSSAFREPTAPQGQSPLDESARTQLAQLLERAIERPVSFASPRATPSLGRVVRTLFPDMGGEALTLLGLPLEARGERVGTALFLVPEEGEQDDFTVGLQLRDFATRLSLALDNARLYAQLREANTRKGEMLALVAHELRNPMTALQVAAEMLDRHASDSAARDWAIATIRQQVVAQGRMLDDMVDVAWMNRDGIPLAIGDADLCVLLRSVGHMSQTFLAERAQTLRLACPERAVLAECDPQRIEQIVWNLLTNASKYSPRGAELRMEVDDGAAAEVTIAVQDPGMGFAPSELPHLFELFHRSRSAQRSTRGGLGIGLALARHLAEQHGGTLEGASPGPGQGSTFTLRLPKSPLSAESLRAPARALAAGAPRDRA